MYSTSNKKEKNIFQGYLKYKKEKNINIFNKIKNKIINIKLNLSKKTILNYYFEDPELSLRQYLINDLLINQSNSFRLRLYGSKITNNFYFPLPNDWKKILSESDIKYNNFYISCLWTLYILKKTLLGLLQALKILIFTKKIDYIPNNFVIIDEVYQKSLPFEKGQNTVFNFLDQNENISVGINYNNFNKNEKFFYFNILKTLDSKARFLILIKYLKFIFVSFLNKNFGDLILASEILKLFIVDEIKKNKCPKKIYVLSTNYLYKPLWIKRLEDKYLVENIMLFYSTNYIDENFQNSEQLKLLTWKKFLTFDLSFKKKLINYNDKFNIKICDKFSLFDKDVNLVNSSKEGTIIIFDHFCFSNINYLKYCNVGVDCEILRPKFIIKFLNDTIQIALRYNFQVYYKTKIHKNKLMSKEYIKLMENFKSNKNFNIIDPYSSPLNLINTVDKAISMPLSTINFFLKSFNKNFITYYPDITKKNYFSNYSEICFDRSILEKFIKE